MALPAGTRLGAYEIVTLIGVGGMGEVYRARDARLNRDVAIANRDRGSLLRHHAGRECLYHDGQKTGGLSVTPSQEIRIIVNWFEELKRLVPAT